MILFVSESQSQNMVRILGWSLPTFQGQNDCRSVYLSPI